MQLVHYICSENSVIFASMTYWEYWLNIWEKKIHVELGSNFKSSLQLRKYGNNGFSLPLTISVPGTKPALQALPETILTQAFAFCQKWQNWALDILFGSSVATCIVSSDSLPGKPSHPR